MASAHALVLDLRSHMHLMTSVKQMCATKWRESAQVTLPLFLSPRDAIEARVAENAAQADPAQIKAASSKSLRTWTLVPMSKGYTPIFIPFDLATVEGCLRSLGKFPWGDGLRQGLGRRGQLIKSKLQ
ncbi:MAG: hypothetical protein WDW36_006314 [Sanguina aurantia]